MIRYLLFVFFIYHLQILWINSYEVEKQIVELNHSQLSKWYGSCSACLLKGLTVLKHNKSSKPFELANECKHDCLQKDSNVIIPHFNSCMKHPEIVENCALSALFLYDGNIIDPSRYDMIRAGYEDYYDTYPLVDLFLEISTMGIDNLLFVGDSTTQYLFFQMYYELIRNNVVFDHLETHTYTSDVFVVNFNQSIFLKAIENNPNLKPKNSTMILHLTRDFHFRDFDLFFKTEFKKPIAVINNFGLHYSIREASGTSRDYIRTFNDDLEYIYNATIYHHPSSVFFFRETIPTFFNAPNGDFMIFREKMNSKSGFLGIPATPGDYPCRPINTYDGPVYENKLVRDYMKDHQNLDRFHLIEVYEDFLPFWTMKNGNESHSGKGMMDCLHFKGYPYFVHVYVPVWTSHLKSVREASRTYSKSKS